MKIIVKNGSDLRPPSGDFSTSTLVEFMADSSLKRVPSNIVFLLDASSSMGGNKWNTVKAAVTGILDSLKDDDRVSLVVFHSTAKEIFPLATLAENRQTMKDSISKMEAPQGVTNLEDGLKCAYQTFDARSAKDKTKRVNTVLLLTDGFPTDKDGYRIEETHRYEESVKKHDHISLTGIGIGSAEEYDATFIGRLSELGKGSYYHANDLEKFKEGLQTELAKLQSSVVGELILKFTDIKSRIMRIAKVAPEIVIYDAPGNPKSFELPIGAMTKDLTAFLIQSNSVGDGVAGAEIALFTVEGIYDGKNTERVTVKVKTTDKESDLGQVDPDVFKAGQVLQVHLNGEQIRLSLAAGDKQKATRLIQNTTQIAGDLGQDKVTRALTRLANDIQKGKSVSDDLATIQDESKKTKLLIS